MTDRQKAEILRYVGAVGIVAVAIAIRALADPILEDRQPFTAFLVAVIAAAHFCGFAPSIVALVLGALASNYLFTSPRESLHIEGLDQQSSFGLFILFGLFVAFVMRAGQRARNHAREQALAAIQKQQALEREVTERKRVEAELQASQDRFHRFMDNGPFAAFMKDEDGKFVYANKFVERILQRKRADILGKTNAEVDPPETAMAYVNNDLRTMQEDRPVHFEEIAVSPDGSIHQLSSIKFPLRDGEGRRLLGGVSIDITDIRKAEQEARQSEAQLLLALDAGRLGMFSWNMTTNQVRSSETFAVLHGRSPSQTEILLDESFKNIHPDDRHIVSDAVERALQGEAPERIVYRAVWADGSIHWIEGIGRVFCDESGKPTHVMGVCADITERKLADIAIRAHEAELSERQDELLLALDAARMGTWSVNLCTQSVTYSETAETMLGYKRGEFPGQFDHFLSSVHPEDRAGVVDSITARVQNRAERQHRHQFRVVWPDGRIRWLESQGKPYFDAEGKPLRVIGMVLDVTERKEAEEKLKSRESQLSGILDNTPAVVYLKDSEGRYLLTNRRYQSLFLREGESMIGKTDRDRFQESFARLFMESDSKVWEEQVPFDFEEVAPHADGVHTYRSVKFPVRDETGKMIAMGGISTDISDLKEAHESLKKERELLRNLIDVQEKERQFLCREFHDGLIQYAVGSLMSLDGYRNTHPPSEASVIIDTVIDNLRKGVDDGRRVIRGIRPAVLDDSGLEAALEDLMGQFSTVEMMVTSKCDPDIGRLPDSVQTTVYRVVQEALNNARHHSGTDVVRIELTKAGGELHLDIRDFGCGFDVESDQKQGFGLFGMTERVRLLGGECLLQSEQDVGTHISVRLPIPPADDEP